MVAAVSKIMRNQDLIYVASKCEVVTQFRNTIGLKRTSFYPFTTEPPYR